LINELVSFSKKKFGTDFSEKLFLEQLVYWWDLDDYIVDFLTKEIEPKEIKVFLENEVKKFVRGELFKG